MNFLLDMPVPPSLSIVLNQFNYSGIHVSKIGLGTATDYEILEKARRDNMIIITADMDFPRMVALAADAGPGLILFRGGNYSNQEMENLLIKVLERMDISTLKQSICVVDKKRIRVTRLPITKK